MTPTPIRVCDVVNQCSLQPTGETSWSRVQFRIISEFEKKKKKNTKLTWAHKVTQTKMGSRKKNVLESQDVCDVVNQYSLLPTGETSWSRVQFRISSELKKKKKTHKDDMGSQIDPT